MVTPIGFDAFMEFARNELDIVKYLPEVTRQLMLDVRRGCHAASTIDTFCERTADRILHILSSTYGWPKDLLFKEAAGDGLYVISFLFKDANDKLNGV